MYSDTTNKIPGFLKVICILTFIWSAYSLYTNYKTLNVSNEQYQTYADRIDKYLEKESDAGNVDSFNFKYQKGQLELIYKKMEIGHQVDYISLILILLSLAGAIFMLLLKKIGFYMYVIAQLFMFFLPVLFFDINYAILIMLLFNGVFTAGFIIMYYLNLKHLK